MAMFEYNDKDERQALRARAITLKPKHNGDIVATNRGYEVTHPSGRTELLVSFKGLLDLLEEKLEVETIVEVVDEVVETETVDEVLEAVIPVEDDVIVVVADDTEPTKVRKSRRSKKDEK